MALLLRLKRATLISYPYPNIGDFMSDDRSSSLRLVTAPASEPITLAQAKTFLRIEHSADDEPVTRAITAARQAAEQYLKVALLPQTWDYVVANPPATKLCLPFGPVQTVTSITLTTESGATSSMNVANYRLSVDGFSLLFNPSVDIEKITIRFVAGIATVVADIPTPIVQGMLHHLTVLMETRDGTAPLPMQSMGCYQPYRRISL
jgi:uncharacterized phiE125 gp8 family phage protein